jgi:hypothetical protein
MILFGRTGTNSLRGLSKYPSRIPFRHQFLTNKERSENGFSGVKIVFIAIVRRYVPVRTCPYV